MLRPCPKPVREAKEPKRLRAKNPERAAEMRDRNFPDRPPVVWCLLAHRLAAYQAEHGAKAALPKGWSRCWGPVDAAHVVHARGAGGCNSSKDEVAYLCRGHHREQEGRSEGFEHTYGIDLKAEAAKVAAGDFGPEAPA
ncbi:MAG: hypothetical protein VW516_11960 [Rhodospirillaceae bacterium]|jgi:hypothetical protein